MDFKRFIFTAERIASFDGNVSNDAQITNESFSVGNVYLGQNFKEVIAMYGLPLKESPAAGTGSIFSFCKNGKIFDVRVSKQSSVEGIRIEGDSGIKTVDGIGINSSLKDVYITYGKPDKERFNYNNNYLAIYSIQPSPNSVWELSFETKSNLVVAILINDYPCYG